MKFKQIAGYLQMFLYTEIISFFELIKTDNSSIFNKKNNGVSFWKIQKKLKQDWVPILSELL
jgi:hypothetical protein